MARQRTRSSKHQGNELMQRFIFWMTLLHGESELSYIRKEANRIAWSCTPAELEFTIIEVKHAYQGII